GLANYTGGENKLKRTRRADAIFDLAARAVASVDFVDDKGKTPLHWACDHNVVVRLDRRDRALEAGVQIQRLHPMIVTRPCRTASTVSTSCAIEYGAGAGKRSDAPVPIRSRYIIARWHSSVPSCR